MFPFFKKKISIFGVFFVVYILVISITFLTSCAGTDNKPRRPYQVKNYKPGFDFSKVKKNTRVDISHVNGVYYSGEINRDKSGPGILCINIGKDIRCFKQKNIKEITEDTSEKFRANNLLVNITVVAVFLILVYFLPSP